MDMVAARETTLPGGDAAGAWRRIDVRESMLLMATLAPEVGGPVIPLRVRNLSASGLMGECDQRYSKDTRVLVELRNIGAVSGTIAWVAANRIGIRFDHHIDPRATRKAVGTGAGNSKMIVGRDSRRPGLRLG